MDVGGGSGVVVLGHNPLLFLLGEHGLKVGVLDGPE